MDSPQTNHRAANAREVAMNVLTKVEEEHAYSNLLLHQTLQKTNLEKRDVGLVTELVYGTIQRKNTIDYFLNRFLKGGMKKLQPWVRNLLRLSFYQLYYLERIPIHAAVNEAVNIAKRKGHKGISGLVNGVLRNVVRQKNELKLPENLSTVERISLEHSHPAWMVSRWIDQHGEEVTEQICKANNEPPKVSVRVNTLRHTRENIVNEMKEQAWDVTESVLSPSGLLIEGAGNMALTDWYSQGNVSIQDESSMLVAEVVDPQPGMEVLDCCAAPGGKTMHMAEKMKDTGKLYASDIHSHKIKLIQDQAARLDLSVIQPIVSDARQLTKRFPDTKFDRILVDAPCTGFGVIRRKPEIKWTKEEQMIDEITSIQFDILSEVKQLLKPEGVLVYSTCTIEYAENEGMVEKFLQENPDFERVSLPTASLPASIQSEQHPGQYQVLPHQYDSDGFFIARLRKRTMN